MGEVRTVSSSDAAPGGRKYKERRTFNGGKNRGGNPRVGLGNKMLMSGLLGRSLELLVMIRAVSF